MLFAALGQAPSGPLEGSRLCRRFRAIFNGQVDSGASVRTIVAGCSSCGISSKRNSSNQRGEFGAEEG